MYVDIDEDGGKLVMIYNTKWQPFLRIYTFLQSKHHIKKVVWYEYRGTGGRIIIKCQERG